jgi:FtsP/CotA-like multicopper oxidase with cupredoxin domain
MRPINHFTTSRHVGLAMALVLLGGAACDNAADDVSASQAAVTPSTAPELDPTTIPRFQTNFQRPFPFVATRNGAGQNEYTVQINTFKGQQLPSTFPQTTLFGYGGNVLTDPNGNPSVDGTGQVAFRLTSPGPKFEQTKGVPALIHYRNQLTGSHPLAVDPTLDWANPNNFPKPLPPFAPFPPGYPQAQSPIAHTTHTHGLEVLPAFDGTPDTWFTNSGIHGPEFVSNDYTQPSSNQSAAFWYHDHVFGETRLDVGMGLSGFSILRDPNNALDVLGNSDILGMEDVYQWKRTSGVTPGNSTTHSQGSFSVSLTNPGITELRSDPFILTATLPSSITVDLFIPTGGATGNAFMFVDCPSKGLTRFNIGNVSLSGRTQNAFNTLTFNQVPSSQIGSSCVDFRLTVRLQGVGSGTYLFDNIRGPRVVAATPLPSREFEVPLLVQSRSFRTDGEIFYPLATQAKPGETVGANPDVNPYWLLMFDGDTNVVNGTVWPNMNVQRHAYRFRFLNSSNQRFYRFSLSNGMPFTIIGEDGGYLRSAQSVAAFNEGVTERVDTIVDFSNVPVGTKIVMQNTELRQPPIGAAPDPNTDGTVMQFTVVGGPTVPPRALPATLNNIATLTTDRPTRFLVQNVQSDDAGRLLQAELDGQLFHTLTTELPTVGSTEDWAFINTTPLTHNKHVHLIEFQVVKRQAVEAAGYLAAWKQANGNPPFSHPTLKLDPAPFLSGPVLSPAPEESGWKDTVRTPAGEVTWIRIRWAPQQDATGTSTPGVNQFPFDPTFGIGYIWHCHLVEHEDNEMMRPMTVIPTWAPGVAYPVGFRGNPGVTRGLVDFNAVDYSARVAHTSVAGATPDTRPDLWERINNGNGDWAVQIIYNVGDRVFFGGHVYQALQMNQATNANRPDVAPAVWQLVF